MSSPEVSVETRWYKFLSRWSLLASLVTLSLLAGFFVVIIPYAGKGPLPMESGLGAIEFGAALNQPALYRILIACDVTGWIALAGLFITFAALFVKSAPIRSTFIAACGAGMTAGLIGAYTRSTGTTELATRYLAASPAQQATILQSYLDMVRAFTAHFGIGELLWGTA